MICHLILPNSSGQHRAGKIKSKAFDFVAEDDLPKVKR
jgi:hypothetical protein